MSRKHDKTGRSRGEAHHVRLYDWMMASAAWRHLDAFARAALIDIMARSYGYNNGKIPYSIRECAASLGIGKSTAARALERLQDHGFIVPEVKGAFAWKVRHSTRWRLTEFPVSDTGELATKEFMRWQPGMNFTVPVAGPRKGQKKQKPVPVAGPYGTCSGTTGTCSGTEDAENGLHGTCSGTVGGQNDPVSVPVAGQFIVTRGSAAESTVSLAASPPSDDGLAQRAPQERRSKQARPSLNPLPTTRSGALRTVNGSAGPSLLSVDRLDKAYLRTSKKNGPQRTR